MKYIFGNWKMNNSLAITKDYVNRFNDFNCDDLTYGIAINNLFLNEAMKLNYSSLKIIAQDVSVFNNGSYTGQTSASMLAEIKIKYAIVGHSETRQYLNVNDHDVNLKAKQCIAHNITPIICIGENKEIYENEQTIDFLIKQLECCLKDIDLKQIIVAYEPLWSIGTGNIPSLTTIETIIATLKTHFSQELIIIYGGSVNESNIVDIYHIKNLDGLLIGSASINCDSFINLINKIK